MRAPSREALRRSGTPLAVLAAPLVLLGPVASYGVRTLTAVVCVVVLVHVARAGEPEVRRARLLLAAALGAGVVSGLLAAAVALVTDRPAQLGGPSDLAYLLYAPLAVVGLLALPRTRAHGDAPRALADATVAACALAVPVIGVLDGAALAAASGLERVTALAYPVVGVFVVTVLVSVLPRVAATARPLLNRAGPGLALLGLSDLAYAVQAVQGTYSPASATAVVNQLGLAVLLAASLARCAGTTATEQPVRTGQVLSVAAPFLPVVPCLAHVAWVVARGEVLSTGQLGAGVGMTAALVARQLLATAEQQRAMQVLRRREREASSAARRDGLTGLGNRSVLHDALRDALARPGATSVALVLLDLDDFKDINDRHGHETGDAVLAQVAARLRSAVGRGVVARLGGDEFAVVVEDDPDVRRLGRDVASAFGPDVVLGSRRFTVTASVGVVLCDPQASTSAAEALSHADVAMYQAKAHKSPHRSRVVVLAGAARARAAARVRLRDEVGRPDLAQFRMVYQPVVDLRDGRLAGAEALMRWDHPVLGEVSPSDFIPLAEQVGAVGVLGEHALRTALGALAGWLREAPPGARGSVGVNLSPRQLGDPALPGLVAAVLDEHGLEPWRLVLEITEQALLDDWDTAVTVVRRLREHGVGVAVDDFGTGYSSLSYLRRFATSTLKVDQEFVAGLADEARTRALVGSVVAMAASLDLITVAEGVETLDQLHVLRALGCDYGQGFLFDRPLEADDFGALLVAGHHYPLADHPLADRVPVPAVPARRTTTAVAGVAAGVGAGVAAPVVRVPRQGRA